MNTIIYVCIGLVFICVAVFLIAKNSEKYKLLRDVGTFPSITTYKNIMMFRDDDDDDELSLKYNRGSRHYRDKIRS